MKKVNKVIKTLGLLLSTIMIFSCDLFNKPVKEYFKEYTETAQVAKHAFEVTYPLTDEGIPCLPSDSDKCVSFLLMNPQAYDLKVNYVFDNDDVSAKAASVSPAFSFRTNETHSTYYLTFKKEFLELLDGTLDYDISGKVTLRDEATGRDFLSYKTSFFVNTPPESVRNIMFQRTSESGGEYVLCFFAPVMSGTIQQDINRITIKKESEEIGTWYMNSTRTVFSETEGGSGDDRFTNSYPVLYPLADGGYDFNSYSVPEGYKAVFFKTGVPVTDERISYSIILTDIVGLRTETNISNKAEQLTKVTMLDKNGNAVTDGMTLEAEETTGKAIIRFEHAGKTEEGSPVERVSVKYNVLNEAGKIVDTGTKEMPCVAEIPSGKGYTVEAVAQKSYYVDSNATAVSGLKIKRSPVYYVSKDGSNDNLGTKDNPFRTVEKCLETMDEQITIFGEADDYTVYLLSNITPSETDFGSGIYSNDGALICIDTASAAEPAKVDSITIAGYEGKKTIDLNKQGGAIVVSGAIKKFNLKNIEIIGVKKDSGNAYGIYLTPSAENTDLLLENVSVKDSEFTDMGCAVRLQADYENSPLVLKGDIAITGNTVTSETGTCAGIKVIKGLVRDETASLTITGNILNTNAVDCAAGFLLANDSSGWAGKLSLGTGIIKITGNTIVRVTGASEPSNLYIQANSGTINPIQIRGKLASGTEIRLDTGLTIEGQSVPFTEGYGFTEGGNNAGVVPGNYFIGDKYGVTKDSVTGEAVLAISSGGFGPLMNEPVAIELADPTDSIFTPGTAKTITLKAFVTPAGGEKTEVTSAVTEWEINLLENGDPQDATFWSANRNVVTLTDKLPKNKYTLDVGVTFNGRHYDHVFTICPPEIKYMTSAPASGTYKMSTYDEIVQISDWVMEGSTLAGVKFELDGDIELNSPFAGIGDLSHEFSGIIDGKGHTVTTQCHLVSLLKDGEIKNITIAGTISANSATGGIAINAYGSSLVDNCIVKADISVNGAGLVTCGGITAILGEGSEIRNCLNLGNITRITAGETAGLVGENCGKIINCVNCGDVKDNQMNVCAGIVSTNYAIGIVNNAASIGTICGQTGSLLSEIAVLNEGTITSAFYKNGSGKGCFGEGNLQYPDTITGCDNLQEIVDGLNAWIDAQQDPSLYRKWQVSSDGTKIEFENQ